MDYRTECKWLKRFGSFPYTNAACAAAEKGKISWKKAALAFLKKRNKLPKDDRGYRELFTFLDRWWKSDKS